MSRHDSLVTLRQIEGFARQAATLGVEGFAAGRQPARERTAKLER